MGRGRVSERALCSGLDWASGIAMVDCCFDVIADAHHGAGAVFALARPGCTALWSDGIGARGQRGGHEYQFDGARTAAFYGAGAEYVLFLWDVSAGGIGTGGGSDRIAHQFGRWVWGDCSGVCGRVWERL